VGLAAGLIFREIGAAQLNIGRFDILLAANGDLTALIADNVPVRRTNHLLILWAM